MKILCEFNIIEHRSPFTVGVDTRKEIGYFEHVALGDQCSGALWFNGKTLVSHDGLTTLPGTVIELLTDMGFEIGETK